MRSWFGSLDHSDLISLIGYCTVFVLIFFSMLQTGRRVKRIIAAGNEIPARQKIEYRLIQAAFILLAFFPVAITVVLGATKIALMAGWQPHRHAVATAGAQRPCAIVNWDEAGGIERSILNTCSLPPNTFRDLYDALPALSDGTADSAAQEDGLVAGLAADFGFTDSQFRAVLASLSAAGTPRKLIAANLLESGWYLSVANRHLADAAARDKTTRDQLAPVQQSLEAGNFAAAEQGLARLAATGTALPPDAAAGAALALAETGLARLAFDRTGEALALAAATLTQTAGKPGADPAKLLENVLDDCDPANNLVAVYGTAALLQACTAAERTLAASSPVRASSVTLYKASASLGVSLFDLAAWQQNPAPLDRPLTAMTAAATLQQSAAAWQQTLQTVSLAKETKDWASAEYNLGKSLAGAAEVSGTRAELPGAAEAFRQSLRVYDQKTSPVRWREATLWLGEALLQLGSPAKPSPGIGLRGDAAISIAVTDDPPPDSSESLRSAVAVFARLANSTSLNSDTYNWALAEYHLGLAQMALGDREADTAELETAERTLTSVLEEMDGRGNAGLADAAASARHDCRDLLQNRRRI